MSRNSHAKSVSRVEMITLRMRKFTYVYITMEIGRVSLRGEVLHDYSTNWFGKIPALKSCFEFAWPY